MLPQEKLAKSHNTVMPTRNTEPRNPNPSPTLPGCPASRLDAPRCFVVVFFCARWSHSLCPSTALSFRYPTPPPPQGKTAEEIRKTFNIVNDFTPEEEAQVREENKWCEDA